MARVGIVQSISNRRGQVIAEVVLAITILLLLVVTGLLEFGRMMFVYNQMSNAARAGARWAAIQPASSSTWTIGTGGTTVATYLSGSGDTVATVGNPCVRLDVCNSATGTGSDCTWALDPGTCTDSTTGACSVAPGPATIPSTTPGAFVLIRVRTCGSMKLMLPTIFGSIIGNPRQINGVAVFPYQAK